MSGFAKRFVSAVVAGAVVLGTLALYPNLNSKYAAVNAAELYDSASLVNYSTILGRASDYGIIAKKFVQNAHMETTLATNSYSRLIDTNIDVDLTTARSASFIIGEITGNRPYNTIKFGSVHGGENSRYPVYVENINITFADGIDGARKVEKMSDVAKTTTFNYSYRPKRDIDAHIESIFSHADDESDKITARTQNSAYKYDTSALSVNNNSRIVNLDLDNDIYENRVVYINLSDPKINNLLTWWQSDPNGEHFKIKKRSSTVICFTYTGTGNVYLGKVTVDAVDSPLKANAGSGVQNGNDRLSSVTSWSGDISGHNNYVDREIAQKMIWNIPNSSNIRISGSAGTFILGRENANITMTGSPCAGWVISRGNVRNDCEFHYIYGVPNGDIISEGNGQMHFVAHKGFTSEYKTKDEIAPYVDTTVSLNDGDYEFFWQEYTDDTFTVPYGERVTKSISSLSVVDFPTITVRNDVTDSHYKLTNNQTKYFYFRITENPDKGIFGYSNSAGHIDIRLKATSDNRGNVTFMAQSRTYSGDYADSLIKYAENGVWNSNRNQDWVDVVGNRFDLGAFYNRKVVPGYINITKTIQGEVSEEDLQGLTFTVKDGDTVIGNYSLGRHFYKNSQGVYQLINPITVSDSGRRYTVEETLHTLYGYDVSVSYKINGGSSEDGTTALLGTVSKDSSNPTTVAYSDEYEHIPGYINITKTIRGGVTEEDLQGLTFVVKDGDTVVGEYLLGRDFTQNEDGVYELNELIRVDDFTKTYTVVETLHTVHGYDVSVCYQVNGGTEQDGDTVMLDTVSTDADNPTTVA